MRSPAELPLAEIAGFRHVYPGAYAATRARQPALIMANTGETVTYAELDARRNRLAHLLDHYAIFMENNTRYVETCAAGERAGLYYTPVNSFLTAEELAFILNNSLSRVLITSAAKQAVALAALPQCPNIELCLVADGPGDGKNMLNLDEAKAQRIPPYVIFHDTVLRDIAAVRPTSIEELGQIKGVGTSKLQRYGASVLDLLVSMG